MRPLYIEHLHEQSEADFQRSLSEWDQAQADLDHAKSEGAWLDKALWFMLGGFAFGFLFCVGAMVKAVLTR